MPTAVASAPTTTGVAPNPIRSTAPPPYRRISPDISRRNCKMLSLSGISIFERKTSAEEGGQPFAYTV
jgi:hypothetical protein